MASQNSLEVDVEKYFKPNSLTWWTGVAQVAVGVALAVSANVAPLQVANGVLVDLTGGMSAYQYMMMGFGLIGLRGAM